MLVRGGERKVKRVLKSPCKRAQNRSPQGKAYPIAFYALSPMAGNRCERPPLSQGLLNFIDV